MSKQSAGILVYRRSGTSLEVLIGHQGGPFYAKKDKGAWSLPKGEFEDEEMFEAAKREFEEETSLPPPEGEYMELGSVKSKSGKTIYVWAVEGQLDAANLKSNTFKMEWPPKSGQQQEFPEIDRFEWSSLEKAKDRLNLSQAEFIDRFADSLGISLEKPEQTSLL